MGVVLVFWRDGDLRCEWLPDDHLMRLTDGRRVIREETVATSADATEAARRLFDGFHSHSPLASTDARRSKPLS